MGLFPDTIAAALGGSRVQCANLVEFDFTTTPLRLWLGGGELVTNDARRWQAVGNFGAMDGIEQAINGVAPEATFTLSGVDADVMRLARDEFASEVRGRRVTVLVQFFGVEDADDPDNQRCLDNPFPVWSGRILKPSFTMTPAGERTVGISVESLFSLRSRPRFAMYTDSDQQHRFPGDIGFEFANSLINKTVTWPDY